MLLAIHVTGWRFDVEFIYIIYSEASHAAVGGRLSESNLSFSPYFR